MRSLNFLNWPNPSSRTTALRSTKLLTDQPGTILGVKGGRGKRLTTSLPYLSRQSRTFWNPNASQTYKLSRPVTRIALLFSFCTKIRNDTYLGWKEPVAWVRERSIPTERPPFVDEVSVNFCGYRVPCSKYNTDSKVCQFFYPVFRLPTSLLAVCLTQKCHSNGPSCWLGLSPARGDNSLYTDTGWTFHIVEHKVNPYVTAEISGCFIFLFISANLSGLRSQTYIYAG
jgi:hypothetical protein